MSDFFAMGGYAAFVWSAYAVAAIVMAALTVGSLRALKARRTLLDALEATRGRRRDRRGTGRDDA